MSLNVHDYLDYRRFLRDYYEQQKQRNPNFSLRYFAMKAGIPMSTASVFTSVVRGRRKLSAEYAHKFIRGMGLKGKAAEYFECLVRFNDAKRLSERERHYNQLLRLREPSAQLLSRDQYEFFTKWYHTAIWALFGFVPQKKGQVDFARIGRSLQPSIETRKAQQAVEVLERLGLLVPDASGYYQLHQPLLTTGDEVKSLQVASYQVETMRLALGAIDRCRADMRDISTVTLSISQATFEKMKAKVQQFRKELLELARNDHQEERVYQCNLQLFPVTKPIRSENS